MPDIYNPKVSLRNLPVGVTWAKLEAVSQRQLVFDFLVNPEEVVWSHKANFSELAVLYSSQPQLSFKNSASSLSLPNVNLWTPNNSGSLKDITKTLEAMTKPPAGQKVPPLLSLTWGNLSLPRVYLSSYQLREQQWRSGTVTQAIASFDFLIVPEPPKVIQSEQLEVKPKLSDRQQKDYISRIKAKLKKDKNLAVALGIDPDKDTILISDSGNISTYKVAIGNIRDRFPDLLKPSDRTSVNKK